MKTYLLLILLAAVLVITCKKNELPNEIQFEENPFKDLEKVQLTYSKLFDVKFESAWSAIGKLGNNFVFYGMMGDLVRYNTATSEWISQNYSAAPEFEREQKGQLIASGESFLLIASPRVVSSQELKDNFFIYINPRNLALQKTSVPLPFSSQQHYLAAVKNGDEVIVAANTSGKLYSIALNTLISMEIKPVNGLKPNDRISAIAVNGKIIYYFYNDSKQLLKLDQVSGNSTVINTYELFKNNTEINLRCALVGNLFCFWMSDHPNTLCYDFINDKWLDGGKNYFYKKNYQNWMGHNSGEAFYYMTPGDKEMIEIKRAN